MGQSIFEKVLNKGEAMQRLQNQFVQPWEDFLEKGRKAQIGEVHEWNGQRMRKTEMGWVPAEQPSKTARKDENQQPFKWNGELRGPEKYGYPEFEQGLDISRFTESQYKKDGKWTPERMERVHKPIVSSYVQRGSKNPNGEKTVTLMMGAPASGKGHLRRNLIREGLIPQDLVVIDPDDIKTKALAPDYDRYSESNAKTAASFVHEEGSDIAKEVFAGMEAEGYDYLQDKVFSNYDKLVKEINRLTKSGYKVKIFMASCPVGLAYSRMLARGKKTGRYVAKDYFVKSHSEIEETWKKLLQNMPEGVVSAQKYGTSEQSDQLNLLDSYTPQNEI